MRKSLLIISIIISGFLFASMASPSAIKNQHNTSSAINPVFADTLNWKLLGQIKFLKKPSKEYPEGVMFPVINPILKAKNTHTIYMTGFIVPIDNKNYALSKNVFASCFFCGQAGPETIMGIKFKNPGVKLKTDQYVTLQGTFRYNDSDVDDWIYHIDNAVIVSK
jgi:hypothetical protein